MSPSVAVTVAYDGPVARLRLARPERANAFDLRAVGEFRAALAEVEARPELTTLVITGDGGIFSAGGDVREMADADDLPGHLAILVQAMHECILLLAATRLVVVVVVDGVAAGAGVGLVLCADVAIATTRARFLSSYVAVGLTPDCGVSYLMPLCVGNGRAREFVLGGRVLSADDALSWGLVSRVVDESEWEDVTREVAKRISSGAEYALGPAKQVMQHPWIAGLEARLQEETATICAVAADPRTQQRISDFANRSTR